MDRADRTPAPPREPAYTVDTGGAPSVVYFDVRCQWCGRKLAEYLTAPFHVNCPRCKAPNVQH